MSTPPVFDQLLHISAVEGLVGLAVRYLDEAQSYAGPCRNHMDGTAIWVDQLVSIR